MSETLSVQDPATVHHYGLEAEPAASSDISGAPTEIRGLDATSGLREAVPEDSKVLQSLELGEEPRQIAPEDLGGLALGGSGVEVPPLVADEAFESVDSFSDSLAPPEPVPPIQTPEKPEIMESVFELATNPNVDLETRIKAIETYVKNQEAQEDGAHPGETFDDYMARLDRVTAGQEALWSPELKYAREVLQSLRTLRRPEGQAATPSSARTPEAAPVETIDPAEPEPELGPNQTTQAAQTTQKPNVSGVQTNTSNTATNNGTNTTTRQRQQSPTPGTSTPQSSTPTPAPAPTPAPQKQQPPKPAAPAQQAAAAAQAAQGGFDQAEASQSAAVAEKGDRPASTTDIAPTLETNKEESSFFDTLSQEDQVIWEGIVRINEQFKDSEVSEALGALQEDFNPEKAGLVIDRAEKSAQRRQDRGDVFGARQQRALATNLDQLTGHVFGKSVSRAA